MGRLFITESRLAMSKSTLIFCLGLCVLVFVTETQGKCANKLGCSKKIDMNGPMMGQDPQTRKDCCGFCETYKTMWCKDKRGCSKRIDQEGPTMCKTLRLLRTAVLCAKHTRTGPIKAMVER